MSVEKDSIIQTVEKTVLKVHTKPVDMSLNEIADMYENGELIIQPDYQRNFRWSDEQQSRFIESLILEFPIPAIYVIEKEDGIYELIDGLQRISSYLHYRGKLPISNNSNDLTTDEEDPDNELSNLDGNTGTNLNNVGSPNNPLTLVGCDIIPELNGLTEKTMPTLFSIRLKRMPVRVEVIKKTTDPSIKYHLFKRLNTGGEILSKQEIRNCTIRILDSKFIDFIIECSKNPDFIACTSLALSKKRRRYDHELVLRYFTFKNAIDTFTHNIDECLTKYLEDVSSGVKPFDYQQEKTAFESTFSMIRNAYSAAPDESFKMGNKFSVNAYDAISQGVLDVVMESSDLRTNIDTVKASDDFKQVVVGGGLNTSAKLNGRIEIVRQKLRNAQGE